VNEVKAYFKDMPVYALAGDDTHIFSSSSSGEVKEWDTQSGKLINSVILKVNKSKRFITTKV